MKRSLRRRLRYRERLIIGSYADEKFCLAAAKVDRKIRQRLEKMKHLDTLPEKKARLAVGQDKVLMRLFAELDELRCVPSEDRSRHERQMIKQMD